MKHAFGAGTCAAVLVASLTACSGADDKSGLPVPTGGSTPSTTPSSRPTTPQPTGTSSGSGQVALAAHSTYAYGGLKVVVNLPADIPSALRPKMRIFSEFLQAAGKTLADNQADPRLGRLTSPSIAKYVAEGIDAKAAHQVGTLTFKVTKIQPASARLVTVLGCLDQSKVLSVNKSGEPIKESGSVQTLKMRGDVSDFAGGVRVSEFAFSEGSCT